MSEVKVNKISPRTACGTVTLGDSGDTFTIPSGATITNAGTASGFGATGETSWDTTVKTTGTFTATAGVGYFLNTTGGIITVNLAAGTAGDSVAMADYAGTWQTNNVTVAANGTEKIGGVDADVTLSTEGQSVTFVYVDSTQGWVNVLDSTSNVRGSEFMVATGGTPSQDGDYEIRTFTGPGTFCVSATAVSAPNNAVDYLVIAGGAAGGYGDGGGGGAGGFRNSFCNSCAAGITVTASPYTIAVGGGGPTPGSAAIGPDGSDSTFSTITSAGGGGGGIGGVAGAAGGSGGGSSHNVPSGGAGNTPAAPTALGGPQGNTGGGGTGGAPLYGDSGGGGSGAVGANGTPGCGGGDGGAGTANSITGAAVTRAGGGGGSQGGSSVPGKVGSGGSGGGGAAGNTTCASTSGGENLGGGGGGSSFSVAAGNGGSGVVILRYKYQ